MDERQAFRDTEGPYAQQSGFVPPPFVSGARASTLPSKSKRRRQQQQHSSQRRGSGSGPGLPRSLSAEAPLSAEALAAASASGPYGRPPSRGSRGIGGDSGGSGGSGAGRSVRPASPAVSVGSTGSRRSRRSSVGGGRRVTKSGKGRVRVAMRLRPWTAAEVAADDAACIAIARDRPVIQLEVAEESRTFGFEFDHVFDATASQSDVYAAAAADVVDHVLRGCNGTILAYGQTGTGKTYTLAEMGDAETRGVIPQAFDHIFSSEAALAGNVEVSISLVQIYMEVIEDLLLPGNSGLALRETSDKDVFVENLSTHAVYTSAEALELIRQGYTRRAVAATKINDVSSRSHTILMTTVKTHLNDGANSVLLGRLIAVDLAGSERVKKSRSNGLRFDEAKSINLSLTALGNVIAALARSSSTHVPYRDSKLTRLLQDSLGGDCRTSLIVNVGPSASSAFESLSSLQFAQRAMNIEVDPNVNLVTDYKAMCELLQGRVAALEAQHQASSEFEAVENGVLHEQVASLQAALAEVRTEKGELALLSEDLVAENKSLRAEVASLRGTVSKLESEPKTSVEDKERIRELESQVAAQASIIESLRDSKVAWRHRVQTVLRECQDMDKGLRLTLSEVADGNQHLAEIVGPLMRRERRTRSRSTRRVGGKENSSPDSAVPRSHKQANTRQQQYTQQQQSLQRKDHVGGSGGGGGGGSGPDPLVARRLGQGGESSQQPPTPSRPLHTMPVAELEFQPYAEPYSPVKKSKSAKVAQGVSANNGADGSGAPAAPDRVTHVASSGSGVEWAF